MKSHLPSVHTYADDTQLYISFNPVDKTSEADAVIAIENCIRDVRAWMRDDKLMLNDDKTEFLIIGSERQLSKVSVDKIKIGQAECAIWAPGSILIWTCRLIAFYYLYNIRHIRKYLSRLFTRSSQAGLTTVMTSVKNEEDFGRSRVIDGCPLFMEQSSSANKTGNINRLF
ncbi:unnamed protein product [Porites lobata]|uniref:Reverse transcriptase domain-containing protein n=1 Tax=Porites lobata TaxID=104759 RepID=A0ABN8MXS0_9CNID|nr:unnamed protein product [Porites lobata]